MNEAVKGRESERAREWECEGDWVDPLFFTSGMRRVLLAWFFRLSLFHSSSSFLSVHSLLFSFLLGLHGVLPCALHPLLSWRLSLVASVVFLFSCRKKPITLHTLQRSSKVNVMGGWVCRLVGHRKCPSPVATLLGSSCCGRVGFRKQLARLSPPPCIGCCGARSDEGDPPPKLGVSWISGFPLGANMDGCPAKLCRG